MARLRTPLLSILILLNLIVLLGQIWPEGAPPFARSVNIVFLVSVLPVLVAALLKRR